MKLGLQKLIVLCVVLLLFTGCKKAIEAAKAAIEFEDKQQWENAFNSYVKAIEKLRILKSNDENKYNADTYTKKASEYFEKASDIKKKYLSGEVSSSNSITNNNPPSKITKNAFFSAFLFN